MVMTTIVLIKLKEHLSTSSFRSTIRCHAPNLTHLLNALILLEIGANVLGYGGPKCEFH